MWVKENKPAIWEWLESHLLKYGDLGISKMHLILGPSRFQKFLRFLGRLPSGSLGQDIAGGREKSQLVHGTQFHSSRFMAIRKRGSWFIYGFCHFVGFFEADHLNGVMRKTKKGLIWALSQDFDTHGTRMFGSLETAPLSGWFWHATKHAERTLLLYTRQQRPGFASFRSLHAYMHIHVQTHLQLFTCILGLIWTHARAQIYLCRLT